MLILYLAQFLYMYIKDKKAVDRLKTFRTKSLSRLSSFNENEAADDKKKTRLAEAIEKKRLQLEKEIGNAQVWQFGGGCCGGRPIRTVGPEPLHPHVCGPHVALEVGDENWYCTETI